MRTDTELRPPSRAPSDGRAETGQKPVSPFLRRFNRVTSSGKFISEIDGLRFIAIGTVVLFHLAINLSIRAPEAFALPQQGNWLAAVARHGFRGVELFFIISGFILAFPFAAHRLMGRPKVNMKQYFLRRVTRLEPPYMLCMILFFFSAVFLKHQSAQTLFPHLAASLAYLHNIAYGTENLINNVAWSLEIEIQFYLLVPLLSLIFVIRARGLRRMLIVGICLALVTAQWLFIGPESALYLTIARFLQFFLMGFLLADIYLMDWKEKPARRWSWDIVSLIGWPALFILWNSPELSAAVLPYGTSPVIPTFVFPFTALFLYCAVFRGRVTNRIMTNPWITTIGGMCYTIYLFHNQLIGAIIGLTKGIAPTGSYTANLILQGVMVFPLALAACAVYFVLIERPCMKKDWPKQLMAKMKRLVPGEPRKSIAPIADR
jgi:peptidoglycan/LPS O-acetylase OafA/YrhL